ncbi:TPA: hypothetical protein QEM96_000589 [Pseudomonas putida]|nr:hypothetical protein [Pseudomonas putida]
MKSRNLRTHHDVIISNYTITPMSNGKHLHQFTPSTTSTIYQFEANSAPVLKNGERYNIGFTLMPDGRRIVEPSALGKADSVNKTLSHLAAKQQAKDDLVENKGKNDQRVSHRATDGYYWGKKYAWRRYGLMIPEGAFLAYLKEIGHPSVPCITSNPDLDFPTNDHSTAYKDDGLEQAMDDLIESAVKDKQYFKSPLYSKKFQIRPIASITDKK